MTLRTAQSGQGGSMTFSVFGEIAAAKALDWNVELESNLRSGAQVEAATRLGPRLLRLSQEPVVAEITAALHKLEPGQDQVLANAIVRRLADAFQSGGNFTRLCILKVLLLEYKGRKESRAKKCSLFTKDRIPNYVEFLRRVKSVLDSGDSTARSLALRVLGCLAELASDSVEVFRLVLDALQSPHRLEVEGAFFAISCLCEVSVPFAAQAMIKVTAMVNAMGTAPEVKRLAIRLFAKMHLSPQLSLEAHEVGKKLMLRLPTEDVVRRMLVALTDLALHASETMGQQVKLLLCYVGSDPRSTVRAAALYCLNRVVLRATHFYSFTKMDFHVLYAILGDPILSSDLHVSAFQVMQKVLDLYVDSAGGEDLEELIRLSELFLVGSEWSVMRASLSLLVDLCCAKAHLKVVQMDLNEGYTATEPSQQTDDSLFLSHAGSTLDTDLPTRICLIGCDQLALIFVTQCNMQEKGAPLQLSEPQSKDTVCALNKCVAICSLMRKLVHGCPDVGSTVVDYICGISEALATRMASGSKEKHGDTRPTDMDVDIAEDTKGFVKERISGNGNVLADDTLKILGTVGQLLLACVYILREHETKRFVCSRLCSLTTSLAVTAEADDVRLALLPAVLRAWINEDLGSVYDEASNRSTDKVQSISESSSSLGLEELNRSISKLIEEMGARCKYWVVYKIGRLCANANRWRLAESAFVMVRCKVASEGLFLWLEALVQVSRAEAEVWPHETNAFLSSSEIAQVTGKDVGDGMDVDNERFITGMAVHSTSSSSKGPDQRLKSSESSRRERALNDLRFYAEGAVRCIPVVQSAVQTLAAGVCLERTFEFQRWFLSLRCTMLQNFAELVGLLEIGTLDLMELDARSASATNPKLVLSGADDSDIGRHASRLQATAEKADRVAFELKRLSEDFDLLCLSFAGLDKGTQQILSHASLSCSLLAFSVVWLLFPRFSRAKPGSTSTHVDIGQAAYDLLQRLDQMYGEEWDELTLLCMEYGVFHGQANCLKATHGSGSGPLLSLCRWVVKKVVPRSQKVAEEYQSIAKPGLQSQGLHLLKDLLRIWAAIPWQIPSSFFCTRPRAGYEIVVAQLGGTDMSIVAGSALSLGLAFQLIHLPPETAVKSLSCALTVQPAKAIVAAEEDAYAGWRIGWHEGKHSEQLVDIQLIEELVLRERGMKREGGDAEAGALARTVVSLPISASGAGSASCIIDVSNVPSGVYQISTSCVCSDRNRRQWSLLSPRSCLTLRIL